MITKSNALEIKSVQETKNKFCCILTETLRVYLVRELGGEGRGGIVTEGKGDEIF